MWHCLPCKNNPSTIIKVDLSVLHLHGNSSQLALQTIDRIVRGVQGGAVRCALKRKSCACTAAPGSVLSCLVSSFLSFFLPSSFLPAVSSSVRGAHARVGGKEDEEREGGGEKEEISRQIAFVFV